MLSRMMLLSGNVLIMDEPTNHLDLESIQALNNSMKDFKGTILFTSHDHEVVQSVATRIVELGPKSHLDKLMTYDEYIESDKIKEQRKELYK
jgi:ATPase subunit of ABC transporter with duplicated ATPase domains